ncbi:MAG: tetratricopeptide repeat protein [Planctomycetes bacterium]|nr:tetratricopeptide repeat protein [Planctomycetota bacterium]
MVRLDQGQLAEPSGQLHLDFEAESAEPVARTSPAIRTSEEWWEQGCAYEDAGQLHEAAEAYREALYVGGPDAKICFNLANVLYALGHLGQAAERFRQAVELKHQFAEAWNNLGNVLLELGQTEDALKAYRCAIAASPDYADVHYNLADLLDTMSGPREARKHWRGVPAFGAGRRVGQLRSGEIGELARASVRSKFCN